MEPEGRRRTLVGCVLLSGALGTIHAWSLFLQPLEAHLDVGRGRVSAVYSVALLAITVAVLVGHRLFPRLPGRDVAVLSAGVSTVGLLVAAGADSWPTLLAGYGILFGLANGLGYAFALQRSAEVDPGAGGRAMALVTAAYALGAATAGVGLASVVDVHGAERGLRVLALAVGMAGAASASLVGGDRSPLPGRPLASTTGADRQGLLRLWLAYGLAVLAGLTVLGHAAAIVDEAGGAGDTAVTTANFASAASGAWVAAALGRTGYRRLAVGLPVATAVLASTGAMVATAPATAVVVPGVALAYGAIIAVYPTVVRDRYGPDGYPAAYGRVFTAWGVAGLIGPLGAGTLFDATGGYRLPLLLAALAAAASALVARREAGTRNG